MSSQIAVILGLVFATIAAVAVLILILPQKKSGKLSPTLQFLHDFFQFKKLFLEYILKAFYLFSTCLCVFVGFFLLFARTDYQSFHYLYGYSNYSESTAIPGLILLIAGPIILRIVYELFMILILSAKNLLDINRKMDPLVKSAGGSLPSEPQYLYCTQCGTRYAVHKGSCPNCGKE